MTTQQTQPQSKHPYVTALDNLVRDNLPSLQAITRAGYLLELERRIVKAGKSGLLGKVPFTPQVKTISGPRAAAALIKADQYTGQALQALAKSDNALLRQLVPFEYDNYTIAAYLHQWYIRIEASWPIDLQQTVIPLHSICQHPLANGHWVVGVNEYGANIIGSLDDSTPHWLVAGTTGAGKTVALHNLVYQLARAKDCSVVLIDGKFGESLGVLDKLPCVLGPCATDVDAARGALSFVVQKIQERYEQSGSQSVSERVDLLVVVFDEFQEFVSDKAVAILMRKIVSLGRAVKVHCVFATQHPVNAVMGDPQTKRNLSGRLVLQVTDFAASQVAIGQETPRADRLTGKGDCYCQGERVQGALVTLADFESMLDPDHTGLDWYEYDTGSVDNKLSREPQYTVQEVSKAILSACAGEGRELYRQRFVNPPGGSRGARLVKFGREVLEIVRENGEVSI